MVKFTRNLLMILVMICSFSMFPVTALTDSMTVSSDSNASSSLIERFDGGTVNLNPVDRVLSSQELAALKLYNYEHTSRLQELVRDSLSKERTNKIARPQVASTTYALHDNETFWVVDDAKFNGNNWAYAMYEVEAEVVNITPHAYFFQVNSEVIGRVSPAEIDALAAAFEDTIYPTVTSIFGSPPDTDSNGKIIILIFDINKDYSTYGNYVAGYFWSLHTLETGGTVDDASYYSEYKEIIHIDVRSIEQNIDRETVAHEFQHLLHYAHDADETVWLDEGCAVLAEYLCGYYDGWDEYILFSYGFMENPQTSLTYWENNLANYGAVFSFMLTIQDVYGNGTITDIVYDSAKQGMPSIVEHTGATGDDLFANFTYMNAINDKSKGYGYDAFSASAKKTLLGTLPAVLTVEQVPYWAAKYYDLPDIGIGTLNVTVTSNVNITADLLVLNQSGKYEAFNVKIKGADTGEFLLNRFGTDYSNAILVVYSTSGTDSGYEVAVPPVDSYKVYIDMIYLDLYHGSVNHAKTSYSETLTFNNITVVNSLTGTPWSYQDVSPYLVNSTAAIFELGTNEEVANITGQVQWNNTFQCWQAFFANISGLESGLYYIKVTLLTSNNTAVIRSDPFEILRPAVLDEGKGSFKNGVVNYSGIKVGFSNGTVWPSTATASFQLFHENGTLLREGLLLWNGASQSWYLPVVSGDFKAADRVYLVFTFEYVGEELTFESGILKNSTGAVTGFTGHLALAAITGFALHALLNRRKKHPE